jgi:DMSO/TMAO reductase YedYZ molybdopterin-dependent catalytic subunit
MRRKHKILASALAFSFLAIAFSSFQLLGFAGIETTATELLPMSLTVVGATGSQVVLNETDIAALSSYRGYGGFKNSIGIVKGLGNYTGVPLNTLCGLVGGLTNTSIVEVIANDYSSNFTFDEVVNGNFTTYNSNGEGVPHGQPLVPIVAYYFNDVNISESNGGPLRLAIVGPEGLVTNSTHWVKWVIRVEIIDETVPEFPSPLVLSLLLFATSAVAFIFRAVIRKQLSAKRCCGSTGECIQ